MIGSAIDWRSGCRERELGTVVLFCLKAVRTAETARFGTGAERLVNDGLDGTRASPTFGAATEAAIQLLRISRQIPGCADGIADVVVGEDVTGTDNH